MKHSILYHLRFSLAHDPVTATKRDWWLATSKAVHERIIDRMIATQAVHHDQDVKRVYYLSLEFLMGRLFSNSLYSAGIFKETEEALAGTGTLDQRTARRGVRHGPRQRRPWAVSRPASSIRWRRWIIRRSATAFTMSSACSGRSSRTEPRSSIPTTGCATARRGKSCGPEFSQVARALRQRGKRLRR